MASFLHTLKDLVHGLPAVSPLALALLLRKPRTVHYYMADCHRFFRHYAGLRLPAITPWELLDFKDVLTIKLGENGLYAARENSFLMMQLVAMLKPQRVFEIGTSQGRGTAALAMNTPDTTRIFTLDLPPESQVPSSATDLHLIELARRELGVAFRNTKWVERITQLLGDSSSFDYTPYYDSMDLVTVDGSHSFPFVFADSMNAFRMIRPGGVIVWHDYESMRSEYGVTRFVDALRYRHNLPSYRLGRNESDSRYGVMRVMEDTKRKVMLLAEKPQCF